MNRIYYENATEQERATVEAFIERDLGRCQSVLVSMLLERGDVDGMTFEEIENLNVPRCPECGELAGRKGKEWKQVCECADTGDVQEWDIEAQEIYEWWPTTSYVADRLSDLGECILRTDYGDWWGRCCTGQSIVLDPTWWDFYQETLQGRRSTQAAKDSS